MGVHVEIMGLATLFLSFLSTALSCVSMFSFIFFLEGWTPFGLTSVNVKGDLFPVLFQDSPALNNLTLITLFCLFHTLLARPSIKTTINSILGTSEKQYPSIFAITASVLLLCLSLCWLPMNSITLWSLEGWQIAYYTFKALSVTNWCLAGFAVLSINRFQLCGGEPLAKFIFGEQKWLRPQSSLVTDGIYGLVRHPAMLFMIMGIWITPVMTIGHLVLAVVMTTYIAIAVHHFEEPQLVEEFGESYRKYMKKVPYQLIPCVK